MSMSLIWLLQMDSNILGSLYYRKEELQRAWYPTRASHAISFIIV
jgi:hypothetical protein